jgi:cell division protein FtsB
MTPTRRTPPRRPGNGRPGAGTSARGTSARRPASSTRASSTRTSGTTRTAGPAVPGPGEPPGEERGRPSGRIAVVVLVLLVLVISYASSLRAWLAQRDEIDAARAELVQTQERVDQLRTDAERWQDPAFVTAEVRRRLGWVLPGEVGYRVLGPDGRPVGGDVSLEDPVAEPEEAPVDWYSSLWGSVEEAGVDPEEAAAQAAEEAVRPDPDAVIGEDPDRDPRRGGRR